MGRQRKVIANMKVASRCLLCDCENFVELRFQLYLKASTVQFNFLSYDELVGVLAR